MSTTYATILTDGFDVNYVAVTDTKDAGYAWARTMLTSWAEDPEVAEDMDAATSDREAIALFFDSVQGDSVSLTMTEVDFLDIA